MVPAKNDLGCIANTDKWFRGMPMTIQAQTPIAAVAFHKVSKSYQHAGHAVTVLDGISGSIPRGAIVTLVGPSGSGKSTLLSLCNSGIPVGRVALRRFICNRENVVTKTPTCQSSGSDLLNGMPPISGTHCDASQATTTPRIAVPG